jgi:uncharacterized protein HemX
MIEISLPSFLTIVTILGACIAYAVRISYRMGGVEQRLKAAERQIEKMQEAHATKDDFANLKESIDDIKKNIGKLFGLIRDLNTKQV